LLVTRSTAPVLLPLMLETSCWISMVIESPSLICGLTLRVMPTSLRSMVRKGLEMVVLPELEAAVYSPVTKGTF